MAVETRAQARERHPGVQRHRFTVDEFHRLGELGFFAPTVHVEFLDGEFFEMPPIGPGHAGCVEELAELLRSKLPPSVLIRSQNPIALGSHSEPEPDLAVVVRRPGFYRSRHPTAEDVLLLIEVSDTTLEYDRAVKGPIYAAAGIADYWIVNLAGRQVLVLREPRDGQYTSVQALVSGDAARPLAFGEIALEVAAILA